MEDQFKCQECEELHKARQAARRDLNFFRPVHSTGRPKSRWFKADLRARASTEEACHLAEARYEIHRASHEPDGLLAEALRSMGHPLDKL